MFRVLAEMDEAGACPDCPVLEQLLGEVEQKEAIEKMLDTFLFQPMG